MVTTSKARRIRRLKNLNDVRQRVAKNLLDLKCKEVKKKTPSEYFKKINKNLNGIKFFNLKFQHAQASNSIRNYQSDQNEQQKEGEKEKTNSN
jgi:hypothetical protein